MSNGIVKVKESDLEDATIEAEEIIKENYAFLKNKLTGFITSSSIGIEKYRKILIEEIKSIIAIEKSVKGLDKEVIKGKSKLNYDPADIISKYDSALKESEEKEKKEIPIKNENDDLRWKYAMLGGFGASYIILQEEIENPKNLEILEKCKENLGKITISLPENIHQLIKMDRVYIEKIFDYLNEKDVLVSKDDKDFGILYGKYLITKLRYDLQQDQLKKWNSNSKLYKQLVKLRLQLNGIAVSEMNVEDLKRNRRIGEGGMDADLAEVEKVEWEEVIGQQEAKKILKDSVVRFLGTYDNLTKESIFEKVLGTKPPKAVLLYGPPGVGKTFMLKAVITEAEKIRETLIKENKIKGDYKKIKFIVITPDQIKDKYIGESAKAIKSVFNQAKKESPALLVIDEIDAFFSRRGERGFNEGEREIVSVLMQELEGIKDSSGYVLVGITNMPKLLDKAILNRFDRKIEFFAPKTPEEVTELFKVYLKNLIKLGVIPEVTPDDWKKLGEVGHSLGFTGRTIRQFTRNLEQERNDILTGMYKNNLEIIEDYYKNQKKMREALDEKSKKFTIGYICQKMGEFVTHIKHAEVYNLGEE